MRYATGVVALFVLLVACKVVTTDGPSGKTVSVADMRLTNEISSWTESGSAFGVYVGEQLRNPINGEAEEYLNWGLQETAIQEMSGNDQEVVTIYVMDFGTAEKAAVAFGEKKRAITVQQTAGSFDGAVAILDASIPNGCTAYANFGVFYLELRFTGFQDKLQSYQVADLFLQTYRAKMN